MIPVEHLDYAIAQLQKNISYGVVKGDYFRVVIPDNEISCIGYCNQYPPESMPLMKFIGFRRQGDVWCAFEFGGYNFNLSK